MSVGLIVGAMALRNLWNFFLVEARILVFIDIENLFWCSEEA
jgi:hypothetical protein